MGTGQALPMRRGEAHLRVRRGSARGGPRGLLLGDAPLFPLLWLLGEPELVRKALQPTRGVSLRLPGGRPCPTAPEG